MLSIRFASLPGRPCAGAWFALSVLSALLASATFLGCRKSELSASPPTPRTSSRAASGDSLSRSATADTACQAPQLRWAKRFQAACRDGLLHLTVLEPWRNRGEAVTYVLRPRPTTTAPGGAYARRDTVVVDIPLRQVGALVSVQTAFLQSLGMAHRIRAVSAKRYLFHPDLRARIDSGQVLEVGDGSGLDLEKIASLRLDAVFHAGSADPALDGSERLRRIGLVAVQGGEWMESHPLGRAEWVKFFAAFLGASARADSLFLQVESAYLALRDSLQALPRKRTALCGAPWHGLWHVPGGRSYVAQIARDAGLSYLWSQDTSEGSLPLSPEAVLVRARKAELWLNPGSFTSLDAAAHEDSRYTQIAAFRRGQVYSPSARISPDGGNDYWESAVVHPELLLADLAALARGRDDSLYYWLKLPAR